MSIPLCILGQPLVGVELLAAADARSVRALTGNPDDTRVIARFSWHRSLIEVGTRSPPAAEDAGAWELIPGATRPTYRCTPEDVGRWLRVTVMPLSASSAGRNSGPPSSGGARDSLASSGSFGQAANRPLLRAVAGPIQQAPEITSDAARPQQAQPQMQQQLSSRHQAESQDLQLVGQSLSQPSPRLHEDMAATRRFLVDCEYKSAFDRGHVVRVHLSPRQIVDDRGARQPIEAQQPAAGMRETSSPGRLLAGSVETATGMVAALSRRMTSPSSHRQHWSDASGRPPTSFHKGPLGSVHSHERDSLASLGPKPSFTSYPSPRDIQQPQQQAVLPPETFPLEHSLDAQEAPTLPHPTASRVQFHEHTLPPQRNMCVRRVTEPPSHNDHPVHMPRTVSEAGAGMQVLERPPRSPPHASMPVMLEDSREADHPSMQHPSMQGGQQEAGYPATRHVSMQGGHLETDPSAMRRTSMQRGEGVDYPAIQRPFMQGGQQEVGYPPTRHASMQGGQEEVGYPPTRHASMQGGQQETDYPAIQRPPSKRGPDWSQDSQPGSSASREQRWTSLPGTRPRGDGPYSITSPRGQYEEFLQMAGASDASRNSSRQRGASSPGASFPIRSAGGGGAAVGLQRPPLVVPQLRPDSIWGDLASYQARANQPSHAAPGPMLSQPSEAHNRRALSVQLPSPQQQFGDPAAMASPPQVSLPQPVRLDQAFLAVSLNASQEQTSSQGGGGSGLAGGWQGAVANRGPSTSGGGSGSLHSCPGSASLQEALEELLAQHQEMIQQVASDNTEAGPDRDQNIFRRPSGAQNRPTMPGDGAPLPPRAPHDSSVGGARPTQDAPEGPVQPPLQPQQPPLTGIAHPNASNVVSAKQNSGTSDSSSVSLAGGFSMYNSTKVPYRSSGGEDLNDRPKRASAIHMDTMPSSAWQANRDEIPEHDNLGRLHHQTSASGLAQAGALAGNSGNSTGGLGDEYLNNLLHHAAQLEAEAVRAAVMPQDDSRSRRDRNSQRGASVPGTQPPGDVANSERRETMGSVAQASAMTFATSSRGGMRDPSGEVREAVERLPSAVVGTATQTSGGGAVGGGEWVGKEGHAGSRPRVTASSSSSVRDVRDMNEALSHQLAESMRLQMQMQTALAAAMEQLTSLQSKDQTTQRHSPQRASPPGFQQEADSGRSVCVTASAQDAASASASSPSRPRALHPSASNLRVSQSAGGHVGSRTGAVSSPTFGHPPRSPRKTTACVVELHPTPVAQQPMGDPNPQSSVLPNASHTHASVQTHGPTARTHASVQTVNNMVADVSRSAATEGGGQVRIASGRSVSPTAGGARSSPVSVARPSTVGGARSPRSTLAAAAKISVGVGCIEGPGGGAPLPGGTEADTVSVAAMRELLHQHHLRWRAKKAKLKEQAQAWQYTAWRYATAWKKARAMLEAVIAAKERNVSAAAAAGAAAATASAPAHPQSTQPDATQCCPPPKDFHPLSSPRGPVVVPTQLDAHASDLPGADSWQLNPPAVMAGIAAALQRRRDRHQGTASERPQAHARSGAPRGTSRSPNAAARGVTLTGDKLARGERYSPDRMRSKAPSQRKRFIGHSVASYGATEDMTCYSQSVANTTAERDVVRSKPYPAKDVGAYLDERLDSGRLRDQGSRGRSSSAGRSRNGAEPAVPEVAAHWPATLRIGADGSRSRSPSPPPCKPPWRIAGTTSPPGSRPIRVKQDSVGATAGIFDLPAWPTVCPPEPPQPFQQLKPPNAPCRDPDGWWQYPDGWLDIYNPKPPHMLVQHANAKRHDHPRYSDGQGHPASNEIDKAVHPT